MTPETHMIVNLMVLFAVKHFVCDFLLQTRYMLGKFHPTEWVLPLGAHCAVHAVATFVLTIWYVTFPQALFLVAFDFVTHFIIDKVKVNLSRGLDPKTSPEFWFLLGADQFLHSIVHILIIIQAASFVYG